MISPLLHILKIGDDFCGPGFVVFRIFEVFESEVEHRAQPRVVFDKHVFGLLAHAHLGEEGGGANACERSCVFSFSSCDGDEVVGREFEPRAAGGADLGCHELVFDDVLIDSFLEFGRAFVFHFGE